MTEDKSWHQEALRLKVQEGYSWTRVYEWLDRHNAPLTHDAYRKWVTAQPQYQAMRDKTRAEDFQKSSVEYKRDGTIVSEKFITVRDGEEMTPEFILEAHGLDPVLWEVVSYKNNFWNSQVKGGAKQISYQSKLTVKPKVSGITFEDIDQYFAEKVYSPEKPSVSPLNYDPSGDVLEIDLPDLHNGLLAWRQETGADYDIHIAEQRFYQCAYDIVERCSGKKIKKIFLVTLGDLLHFDNENQTTTKGTFQQADGRLPKIFAFTLDMLINFVTILGGIAPVEIIYLPGNHDRVVGYMLLKSLEMAFRNDDNITFDTAPNTQKYRLIGCVLVGWTHGDMQKQNMANWLQHTARKEYGESKFAEVHAGHCHSQKTQEVKRDATQLEEVGGVVIRYLPTISNSSYWEHQQGYTSATKALMAFVWNETTGLRETWCSNIV